MSCPHVDAVELEEVDVHGRLIMLMQCTACKQIGIIRDSASDAVDWSGEIPYRPDQ